MVSTIRPVVTRRSSRISLIRWLQWHDPTVSHKKLTLKEARALCEDGGAFEKAEEVPTATSTVKVIFRCTGCGEPSHCTPCPRCLPCTRHPHKKRYTSKQEARCELGRLKRLGGGRGLPTQTLVVFRCECGAWHIGNVGKNLS